MLRETKKITESMLGEQVSAARPRGRPGGVGRVRQGSQRPWQNGSSAYQHPMSASKAYQHPIQSVSYPRPTATTRHARAYRHSRVRSIGPAGSAYIHESTDACAPALACTPSRAGRCRIKEPKGGEAHVGPGAVTHTGRSLAAALLAVAARRARGRGDPSLVETARKGHLAAARGRRAVRVLERHGDRRL